MHSVNISRLCSVAKLTYYYIGHQANRNQIHELRDLKKNNTTLPFVLEVDGDFRHNIFPLDFPSV